MSKITMALLGILFAAVFLTGGKAFAEQTVNVAAASEEVSKAFAADSENFAEDAVPISEELKDEEVIDTDA